MADVVNDTAKRQLSTKNQEPTHLGGISSVDIGGRRTTSPANSDETRVDGAKAVSGTDSSIPKAVGAEDSHLTKFINSGEAQKPNDVDVTFDGAAEPGQEDDLDTALDAFEAFDLKDFQVDRDGDEDDEKKEVKEDDEFPAFLKKDDDKEDEKEVKEGVDEGQPEAEGAIEKNAAGPADDMNANDGKPQDVKEEDDDEEEKKLEEEDGPAGDPTGGPEDTSASVKEPAAAMNKNGVAENLRIRIKLPKASLFESAGVPKKDQKKVGLVFESVIKDVTKQIASQTNAYYKKLHEEKLAKRDAVLGKQVDSYLSYVVEEWVKANKVAIRQSLRSQLAEDFLNGLQRLFSEHYIDVPQSKVDIVKQLSKQVDGLKKQFNEQTQRLMKLRKLAESANKQRIVEQHVRTAQLSENQIAKLMKLAEQTPYTTAKEFREKLNMLTESYFPKDKKEKSQLTEAKVGDVVDGKIVEAQKDDKKPAQSNDPLVAGALAASKQMNDATAW